MYQSDRILYKKISVICYVRDMLDKLSLYSFLAALTLGLAEVFHKYYLAHLLLCQSLERKNSNFTDIHSYFPPHTLGPSTALNPTRH